MLQALIFDFDGLIFDSETPEYTCWQEIYEEWGAELPLAKWATLIGRSSAEAPFDLYAYLEEQTGRMVERAEMRARRRARFLECIAQQSALPGVEACLDEAKRMGLKLAVASSGSCDWVKGQLTRLNLIDYFDAVKCADDVPRAKPDPALYLAALTALDVPAGRALALEDSPNGVLAARRAGLYCVAIPNTMTAPLDFSHANLVIKSLVEMPLSQLIREFTTHSA